MPDTDNKAKKPEEFLGVGSVRHYYESPGRKTSMASFITRVGGYVMTFLAAGLLGRKVSEWAKEDLSAYNVSDQQGWGEIIKLSFKRMVDPKLWRSNVAEIAVMLPGFIATDHAARKIEEHNYASEHHLCLNKDHLQTVVFTPSATELHQELTKIPDWKDKVKQSEEQKPKGIV